MSLEMVYEMATSRRCTRRKLENPQVTYPICARICARDAAGRIETAEMLTLDTGRCDTR
jgi:hypothetical protein